MDMQYQKRTCNFLNPEDEAKILNGWGGKDFVQKNTLRYGMQSREQKNTSENCSAGTEQTTK